MSTEYHAEHVGSLLRPPWLLAARAARGFASTSKGNLLTIEEERRKLALVADTAAKVWG